MAVGSSTTHENLKMAFGGESQANQKYRAFAEKAAQDGMPNIARLFRTAAEAERIHAEAHLRAMQEIGSTPDNLRAAVQGETYEFSKMYPPMLEQAEAEAHRAARTFEYAMRAEMVHARLYAVALDAAQDGKDLAQAELYLCPVCGFIEQGKPTADCPICTTKAGKFEMVG